MRLNETEECGNRVPLPSTVKRKSIFLFILVFSFIETMHSDNKEIPAPLAAFQYEGSGYSLFALSIS